MMRYDYGDPVFGACKESAIGGNHFRYWVQNGNEANTYVSRLRSRILINMILIIGAPYLWPYHTSCRQSVSSSIP